ncbi:DTX52 [Scenedesmus sp. PABB004]|nr:DTX52 [Scenedesmus sp. PABB004]
MEAEAGPLAASEPLLSARANSHPSEALAEARRLLRLALPSSATGVLAFCARLITTAQVGRLSGTALSALSLGQTLYNITGLSIVVGVCSAIATLVGHADGASEAALKGVILQRGAAVGLAVSLLPLAAWSQAARLLHLLGQPDVISRGAAAYIHTAAPALLLSALNYSLSDYLSAQRVLRPLVLVSGVTTALTPALNDAFIRRAGWGATGAGASLVGLQAAELVLLVAVVAWHNARQPPGLKPWAGLSPASALAGWGPYLALALPCMAMMVLDWWAFEALTLLAGLLPDAEVAVGAMGVCFGLHVVVFLAIAGIATAVCTRVSNELGAGRPDAARRAVVVGTVLGLAATVAATAPMWCLPGRVAAVFTSDPEVAGVVASTLPCLLVALLGDAVGSVLSGAIRGAGRQALGGWVNFMVFWVIGLPTAATAGLWAGWGTRGLWGAMAGASFLQAGVFVAVVAQLDWDAEARRSKHLVRSQSTSGGGGGLGNRGGSAGSGGGSEAVAPLLDCAG